MIEKKNNKNITFPSVSAIGTALYCAYHELATRYKLLSLIFQLIFFSCHSFYSYVVRIVLVLVEPT